MALNPRQARLLETLATKGLLGESKLGSMKAPKISQAPLQNRKPDYAAYLLSGALNDKGVGRAMSRALASNKSAEEEEQGFLTQLFDTMLIPNYTAANIGSSIAQGMDEEDSFLENVGDVFGGVGKAIAGAGSAISSEIFGRGLTKLPFIGDDIEEAFESNPLKQEKKTFQNVLGEDLGIENKWIRHGLGFGLDVGLDPLTYTGFGVARRGAQLGKKAADTLDDNAAIPEAFLKQKANVAKPSVAEDAMKGGTVPFARPATEMPKLPRQDVKSLVDPIDQGPGSIRTRGLQRKFDKRAQETPLPAAYDQPNFKDLTERLVRRQKDWERSMTKLGKVTEGTKLNMAAANKVVQEIQAGRVPRVLPKPPTVAGPAVERAKDIADDVIDSLMGQKKVVSKKNITWQGPDGKYRTRKLPPELTAGMQVSMAGKVLAATGPKNVDEAIGILKAAEDHMIALGVQPVRHEGVRVRLSDVLNLLKDRIDTEIPFETVLNNFARKNMKEMDPTVRQAIQTVAAYRSATMADILENLTTRAEKAKRQIADSYVGGQKSVAEAELLDQSIAAAAATGMTKGELDKVKNLIRDVINVDKIPAEKFFSTASDELMKAFNEGRASGTLISKFNKLVAQNYGYGTAETIAQKVTGIRVVDTLMGAFLTHHGKGALYPKAKGLFEAGEQIAGARATWLRNMSRKYTKDEIRSAWKLAAGNSNDVVSDPRVREMADFLQGYFTEVLKTPSYALRLENAATKHLSVAERSTLLMKDVNRHLKDMGNSFQFTSKNFQRDAWGVQRHFGKDQEGWLASWATQDPTDPLKFLYDIDLAIDRATREYAFLDNFVDVFGSLTKTPTNNFKMPLERIADFYVPQEVGQQMMRVMSDIHKGHWRPRTPLTNFYTQGLRAWKSSVTIYMPSHHIRNGIGDMYLMWLAGHNNPLAFTNAARILHSQRGRYKAAMKNPEGLNVISELTDPNAVRRANIAATQGKDVILKINGVKLTADQLYTNAFHRGLLKDPNRLEDIFGESKIGSSSLFKGRVHAVPAGAAEYREHFIRMAHFTSAVQKSLKKGRKDLDSIFDDAAKEVAKWHPDGTDLTRFEEKYLRNVIPFYSWLRKSTPLLVESLVTRPAKNLAYPRGYSALQNIMGIESTVADPFPDDQLFPEWLKESGIGPIGDPTSPNPFVAWWGNLGRNMINIDGEPYGYTFVNPSNPFIDQGKTIFGYGGTPRDIVKGLFDQASPAIKIPYELGASGREFTGAPIYEDEGGRGVPQYLMKQHGATAPFQRYFDIGEKEREGVEPQGFDLPAFLNNLTALGVYGSGPYIKSAEFEMKEKLAAKKRKEAEK
jgi:hypothetical protein